MSMKRKAGSGALATASPASKRSRRTGETSEEITQKGLEILEALRDSKDKHGKPLTTRFEKLPDRKKEAAWYEQVSLPLSLDIIENKLQQGQYHTMTALESDLLRMIFNWKDVYDRSSEPHKEADKIKKIVNGYMKDKLFNLQYQLDSDYIPIPTPAPDIEDQDDDEEPHDDSIHVSPSSKETRPRGRIILRRSTQTVPIPPESEEESKPPRLRLRAPRRSDGPPNEAAGDEDITETPPPKRGRLILRKSSAPAIEPVEEPHQETPSFRMPPEDDEGFKGKTMTQAQDKIIGEMFELEDQEGNSISGPFVNLPSRELKDYYATIKHPLSIKGAQKLVRGIRGRDKPTGITFLETWQEFEDEISYIWNNARLYNEDESEISKLADLLEKYFKMRVELAKKSVADPIKPKLKLHVNKAPELPIKADFDTDNAAANSSVENTAKYAVDEEALKRQKALVANGVVGKLDSVNSAKLSPAPATADPTAPSRSTNSIAQTHTNGIPQQDTAALPLSTTPRPQPSVTRPPPPPPSEDVKKPWDTWKRSDRPEGFQWPYSTIKEILITSHPSLNLGEKAYRWSLYPWKEFNYASDTMAMNIDTNRVLLSPLLVKPTRERSVVYHHVTLNGVRQQASSSAPRIPGGQASEEDNLYRPVYDIQLNSNDVNEIMVECYTCPSEICETKDVLFDRHMVNIQPR